MFLDYPFHETRSIYDFLYLTSLIFDLEIIFVYTHCPHYYQDYAIQCMVERDWGSSRWRGSSMLSQESCLQWLSEIGSFWLRSISVLNHCLAVFLIIYYCVCRCSFPVWVYVATFTHSRFSGYHLISFNLATAAYAIWKRMFQPIVLHSLDFWSKKSIFQVMDFHPQSQQHLLNGFWLPATWTWYFCRG